MTTTSTARAIKTPSPDHPITIERNDSRIIVKVGGRTIADTTQALHMREAAYPGVAYIPREDIDMMALIPTATSSYCPYKGDCSYFGVPTDDDGVRDVAWSYEAPYDAVSIIRDHIAFYQDRVESIDKLPV